MGVVVGVMGVVMGVVVGVMGVIVVVGAGIVVVDTVVDHVVVVTSDFDCIFVLIKNGYRSPGSIKQIKQNQSLFQNTDFLSGHTTKSLKRVKISPTT